MAVGTATVTLDLADYLGRDFDTGKVRVWLTTNVPGEVIVDRFGKKLRLNGARIPLNADGTATFTTWVPGSDANPTSWQTYVNIDAPGPTRRSGPLSRGGPIVLGPFTITATANLADLITEQAVPPTFVGQALDTLRAAGDAQTSRVNTAGDSQTQRVTSAGNAAAASSAANADRSKTEADRARDISGIAVPADVMKSVDADPNSDFRKQQDARQTATTAAAVSALAPRDGVAVTHPDGLKRWRTALNRARVRRAVIQCEGDSISAGAYANDAATQDTAAKIQWARAGWVGQFRDLISAQFGNAGEGWISFGFEEWRWTYTGATAASIIGPANTGRRLTNYGTASGTFGPFTEIDVLVYSDTGFDQPSSITCEGQFASLVNSIPVQSGQSIQVWRISNLPDTFHKLTINGNANPVDLIAVKPSRSIASRRIGFGYDSGPWAYTGTTILDGARLKITGAGSAVTTLAPCTSIDVRILKNASTVVPTIFADTSSYASKVGATGVSIVTQAGETVDTYRIQNLANVPHTLTIQGGSSGDVIVLDVTTRIAVEPGILVNRVAASGSTSGDHSGAGLSTTDQAKVLGATFNSLDPNLVVLMLGANDAGVTPLATYRANIKTITDKVAARGGCTLLVGGPRYDGAGSSPYYQVLRDLATTETHVAYIDLYDAWTSFAAANAAGFANSATLGIHPTSVGHGDIARFVARAVLGVLAPL